jgi:nitroreductase
MEFLKNAAWRYATKKFDRNRKITQQNLEFIKKSIQLAPSSYGLQFYKVLIIEDQKLKEQLMPHSWNQQQIIDCSHLFVFCNYQSVTDQLVDDYIQRKSIIQETAFESIEGYGAFIKSKIAEKSTEETTTWLKNQTYLALGMLLSICADLKIDSCPMEGFEPDAYNRILNLDEKNLNACVIATTGYRDTTDNTQHENKVRKSVELLFDVI